MYWLHYVIKIYFTFKKMANGLIDRALPTQIRDE
jgi:hypothetical protein